MGEMRGTCQNSLLTAKVTTLFPGPKETMAGMGRCISKDWVNPAPLPTRPLTDEAPQRSRASGRRAAPH